MVGPRLNEQISGRECLLIDANGTQLGLYALPEALLLATRQKLDLVEIAPSSVPPVCRLMDYPRWVKERDARRGRGSSADDDDDDEGGVGDRSPTPPLGPTPPTTEALDLPREQN